MIGIGAARRIAEATSLTPDEIIGTLAAQMRADITDFFDERGNVEMERIKQRGLGHLAKKFKVRRTYEGSGEDKMRIEVLEVELYDAQEAASKLSRIMSMDNHPPRVEIDITELLCNMLLTCSTARWRSPRTTPYSKPRRRRSSFPTNARA